ncbi:MAG: hypothetical protein N3G74_01450 [Candidatus Micrarchaeota archaeon]|nr:hypothetical protein [Candidatus Micrarchaeota archaeon]
MHKARKFIILPLKKENAKKEIAEMLKEAKLPYQKIEEELIGNSPIIWITSPEEKKIISFFKKKNMKAFPSNTSIVKLKDKPGEVAKIARILMSSGLEVEDAHLILKSKSTALYGIITNKPAEADRLIQKIVASLQESEDEEEEQPRYEEY